MAEVAALNIADPPALWRELGFALDGDIAVVGGIAHRLGVPGKGVTTWVLHGAADLSEVASGADQIGPAGLEYAHPNGVHSLDHIVIATPNLQRSIHAFEEAGIALRRTRDAGSAARPVTQAFFRLGPTIAEVVGSPSGSGTGPAVISGLAYTVDDLDATARVLGERLRPSKQAVQPGRRIATLDRTAGSSVPLAFMSPTPKG